MPDRSALSLRDLLAEALASVLQRPTRSALTMLGTVLGIGALVAVLGLTATAGSQIDRRFTELMATEVTVHDVGDKDPADRTISFPLDAASRIQALNGVVHAGVWWTVPLRKPVIAAAPGVTTDATGLTVVAAEPSALAAMHPTMQLGRLFDEFHQRRNEHVAVLGEAAAARLGVIRLDGHPAIFVNGIPYTVLGLIDDFARQTGFLFSIIIPTSTALADYGPPAEPRAQMLIETRVGAASLIASQAPLALRPEAPKRFKAIAPPDPQTLRGNITDDFSALFLMLTAVSLLIGAVGIANTTLISVLERTSEIGLRRALGAMPRHIATQFLTESTALGLLGGLIGSSLGVATVVAVSIARDWTAVMEPWTVLLAPGFGAAVGLLAGVYPALRASRIEPVEALRR